MPNIFISYSRDDQQNVEDIVGVLQAYNHRNRIFYDRQIIGGTDWWPTIVNEIEGCDIFIYILTEKSIASEYCQREYQFATQLSKYVIPVQIKPITIPDKLRHLHILDLTRDLPRNIAPFLGAIGHYEYEARNISEAQGQETLFDVRRSHFAPEKELLSELIVEKVTGELMDNKGQNTVLILDAGSTIHPIFQFLCKSDLRFDRSCARRLKIITNNLPGVASIVRYGRVGQRHEARTVFDTRLLHGFINVQYEACLSARTATDLCAAVGEQLGLKYPATAEEWQQVASISDDVHMQYAELLRTKQEAHYDSFQTTLDAFCNSIVNFKQHLDAHKPDNTKVISVVTGNYVSILDGPLARDKNHVQTKSAMIGLADETYVLAPLGKLLQGTCDKINKDNETTAYETMYHYMPNWSRLRDDNVTLVFTSRPDEYFERLESPPLTAYFHHTQDRCRNASFHDRMELKYDPSTYPGVIKRTAILYQHKLALQEYEIPHQTLRNNVLAEISG